VYGGVRKLYVETRSDVGFHQTLIELIRADRRLHTYMAIGWKTIDTTGSASQLNEMARARQIGLKN
jgi:hypothetical protein